MSIASEISRLQGIKTDIRNALVAKGVSGAASHNFENFASDIGSIVTGTVTPGGLVVAYCSPDITAVRAVCGNDTYQAYYDSTNYVGYITIPYTYTGTVTLNAYAGNTLAATDSFSISAIDKTVSGLFTGSVLYNAGTYNMATPTWITRRVSGDSSSSRLTISNNANGYLLVTATGANPGYIVTRYPTGLPVGVTSVKVTASNLNASYPLLFGVFRSNALAEIDTSALITLAAGENTFTVPSTAKGKDIHLWFGGTGATATAIGRVSKIEFS